MTVAAVPYTKEDIDHAARDAAHIITESPIINRLVGVDILARQLFLLVHGAMITEIRDGWNVRHPELVVQALARSAEHRAIDTPMMPSELQVEMLRTVVPVLEVFTKMQRQKEAENEETIPGDGAVEASGLGELPGASGGDSVEEAGICSQGGGGEAGTA